MNLAEELRSAGVLPTGPVSAWPQERNTQLFNSVGNGDVTHAKKVNASASKMAAGLIKTAGQAMFNGKVSAEVREERYDICKQCPFFVEDSKRCSECGCFMEAKTWVGGDPDMLCPKKKWSR